MTNPANRVIYRLQTDNDRLCNALRKIIELAGEDPVYEKYKTVAVKVLNAKVDHNTLMKEMENGSTEV